LPRRRAAAAAVRKPTQMVWVYQYIRIRVNHCFLCDSPINLVDWIFVWHSKNGSRPQCRQSLLNYLLCMIDLVQFFFILIDESASDKACLELNIVCVVIISFDCWLFILPEKMCINLDYFILLCNQFIRMWIEWNELESETKTYDIVQDNNWRRIVYCTSYNN
jgi:hypothetical protein